MAKELVHLGDVEILKKTDWSLWCRIGKRLLTVPSQVVDAPRPLPLPGETVTLVVLRWFAVDNGLLD
jgi:hypothetical protein